MTPYANSFEHLRDELKRIKILLERAVLFNRVWRKHPASPLGSQIVEPSEVDAILAHDDLLAARFEAADVDSGDAERLEELDDQAADRRAEIESRVADSLDKGIRLPLERLASDFGLNQFELEVLLLAIAPELDPGFERIYAELHDDVTQTRPSVDLALQVLCRNEIDKLRGRISFSPGSNLLHYHFLSIVEDRSTVSRTFLSRVLVPDDSIVRFLLGQPPGVLSSGTILARPSTGTAISAATRQELERFTDAVTRHDPEQFTLLLQGNRPDLLLSAAAHAGAALERSLLFLDAAGEPPSESSILTAFRDSSLWDAILTVRMPVPQESEKDGRVEIQRNAIQWPAAITFSRKPVILLAITGQLPLAPSFGPLWRIEVHGPTFKERADLWKKSAPNLSDEDTRFLGDSFQFSEEQIRTAQFMAYGAASMRNPSNPEISAQDLLSAGRDLASPQLGRFAIPLKPRYRWNDLVLPSQRMDQLRGLANRVKARSTVLRDWGFGAKHTRGNGLNVLFTGGSGNGKTMAAEVLANELSMHMFQIDLSAVVSKYVGQTEKHLQTIFDAVEMSNALLFIDEADALLGKRTELKDAHDRYANIEVNYLLQRIERYQGLVVLCTNFEKNMDEAFMRRLHEVIEFPFPSESSRALIWRRHLPENAPREPDLDFAFLSRKFKLSGGNIANATRNAAYLAAGEGRSIGMRHLVLAVREEYQKLGRIILRHDFEPYFHVTEEPRTEVTV
jgi:hypothetical protein